MPITIYNALMDIDDILVKLLNKVLDFTRKCFFEDGVWSGTWINVL